MPIKTSASVMFALLALSSVPGSARRNDCPRGFRLRTAAEVLDSHRALLAAGDVETDVACNYAEDAVVISDQGVDGGRDAIFVSLSGLVAAFGGIMPTVTEQVVVPAFREGIDMVRIRFTLSTPCIDIPDGTDTYLIKNGQIHAQTAHGLPVFKCGPPPGAP
jgi:hypothetical protein